MEVMEQERVVAKIDQDEAINQQERQQAADNRELAIRAKGYLISNDTQYAEAAEIGKEIKRRAKMVTDLFKPIKEAANKAHKAACEREKELLAPLNEAEKALKASMGAYVAEQERKRREAEEAARREAEAAAQRMLEQAVKLDSEGNSAAAAEALENADVMASTPIVAAAPVAAVKGVTSKKTWDVVIEDPALVPIEVLGVVIRPVDEMALKKLAIASKGTLKVPGVRVVERVQTILRS